MSSSKLPTWVADEDKEIISSFFKSRLDLRSTDSLNTWRLLLTEQELSSLADKVARQIEEKFKGQEIVLACILKGAVFFYVDLLRKLKIPYNCYFIEAQSYKEDQSQGDCEVLSLLNPQKFKGKKIILVDELYDNGKTLATVKKRLLANINIATKAEDIFTCVLLQKTKSASSKYPSPDFVGLNDLPDIWVVGYGLDDSQEKRGWTHLFGVPRKAGEKVEADEIFTDDAKYKILRNKLTQTVYN